jgi:branched-chain amino acid transport system ATP-binding protein
MLTVRDIEVTYQGAVTAVQGASLEVPDSGVVALLGANGAGKTTILRAIGGMLRFHGGRITRGTVEFDNMRLDTLDAAQIVRLGVAQCWRDAVSSPSFP